MAETTTAPTLVSAGILLRGDGQMLLLRHAAGPFAGRWSMPLVGVAPSETAEEALERLLRDVLQVQPGPFEFLDTINARASDGTRFVLNAFSCVGWRGEPALVSGAYDQAVWAPPAEATILDLLPEVRDWIAASAAAGGRPAPRTFDARSIERTIAEARGELIAAYDAVPASTRRAPRGEGWSPLDVLAHAADAETYFVGEARRCLAQRSTPGRTWRLFNDAQWADTYHSRPAEDEAAVRARVQDVRGATLAWLASTGVEALNAWVEHETRGPVQIGARLEGIAEHDRAHARQLTDMAAEPPRES